MRTSFHRNIYRFCYFSNDFFSCHENAHSSHFDCFAVVGASPEHQPYFVLFADRGDDCAQPGGFG
jgi:hypothetical protein